MKHLTDEELAELRRLLEGVGSVKVSGVDGAVTVTAEGDLSDAMLKSFAAAPRLIAEVERRRGRDARFVALLKRIERNGTNEFGEGFVDCCPECRADLAYASHTPDCELATLIGDAATALMAATGSGG
jgi:hypothetical protein